MNTFDEENLMTNEEAKEILLRLSSSMSAALLGFSLVMNKIINSSSDDRKNAHRGVDALTRDMHRAVDEFFNGKLGVGEGVEVLRRGRVQ